MECRTFEYLLKIKITKNKKKRNVEDEKRIRGVGSECLIEISGVCNCFRAIFGAIKSHRSTAFVHLLSDQLQQLSDLHPTIQANQATTAI